MMSLSAWMVGINVVLSVVSMLSSLLLGKGNMVGFVTICGMFLLLVVYIAMACLHNTKWPYLMISWILPRSKPIILIDFEGDRYHTLATLSSDGAWECPLYYFSNTARCRLLDDGTVDPEASTVSYVRYWIPMRQDELVMHQLVNDVPDLDLLKSRSLESRNLRKLSRTRI